MVIEEPKRRENRLRESRRVPTGVRSEKTSHMRQWGWPKGRNDHPSIQTNTYFVDFLSTPTYSGPSLMIEFGYKRMYNATWTDLIKAACLLAMIID
uniref:Protein kinase domain-containing protein n=1 Tax=Panagrellus redivivus TaxID=6233 RepID=A0A7E4V3P4_PANRE